MVIAVDFDGTIVRHRYPAIGEEIPFAVQTLKMLQQDGHRLILWTVREREELEAAVHWCRAKGLEFYAVNSDFPEEQEGHRNFSRKLKADLFIDDRSFGGLPEWGMIYHRIKAGKALDGDWDRLSLLDDEYERPRKGFWARLFGG
ncbi:MAG: hypothetical protein SOW66_03905 [Porphyromonas sp.]|nr:hypothetical protein [Porphyromonas sp.]